MTGACLSPALSSSLYVPHQLMEPIIQSAWVCGASLKLTVQHEGCDHSEWCICYGHRGSEWCIPDKYSTQVPDPGKIDHRSH
jgi:hypothetical protein